MYGPGDEVIHVSGKPAVIEKGLGGDDHIIRFRDGSRLAVPARHLTLATAAPKAEAPADLVEKTAAPPEGNNGTGGGTGDPLSDVFRTGAPASNAGASSDNSAAPAATP